MPLVLRDLKMGDGLAPAEPLEEVKIVQRRLNMKLVDGRFGGGTRDAVIAFQLESGLAPKGVKLEELRKRGFGAVKKATWEKLFAVRA
jgi:peptidoglycan hydrolase-like protein with peptidoglycan-binding domain